MAPALGMGSNRLTIKPELTRRPTDLSSIYRPRRNPVLFEPYDEPAACLSTEPHDEAVEDPIQHYFGCIEIRDRPDFLDESNDVWTHEREVERKKLELSMGDAYDNDSTFDLEKRLDEKIKRRIGSVAIAIEAQYKRTEVLRKALRKPLSPDTPPCLVDNVEKSRNRWMNSSQFKYGITEVRKWRQGEQGGMKTTDDVKPGEYTISNRADPGRAEVRRLVTKHRNKNGNSTLPYEMEEYNIERDVNAYLIQFSVRDETNKTPPGSSSLHNIRQSLKPVDEDLSDARFKGTFPDQRISMSWLLNNGQDLEKEECDPEGDWNILRRDRKKDDKESRRIRYFHIPSNNMAWVEKAIANYYGDETPDLSSKVRNQALRTSTQMLLGPQYWRGQQQGTRSGVVHARHMRALCEVVSSEPSHIEQNPKNIVLFMPYLHWETDRMRESISKMIDEESDKYRQKQEEKKIEQKKLRISARSELARAQKTRVPHDSAACDPVLQQHITESELNMTPTKRVSRTLTAAVTRIMTPRGVRDEAVIDHTGRLCVKNALGQYLVDAARLYEAMSTFRDQRMLEKYLFHDPPLHPRRTLDQSFYWTLRTTKARDRDQVVYRDTHTNRDLCHKLEKLMPPKETRAGTGCFGAVGNAFTGRTEPQSHGSHRNQVEGRLDEEHCHQPSNDTCDPSCKWRWTDHDEKIDQYGCDQCRSDIKKVSQLVMVDQLWMWVLDEETIITSFPRRYGVNKHDLSGVHRSIRTRLKSVRKNQIRSVYDLALIILDECSNTFFDRTRADEGQPQVVDIFSEAIGRVTNQHTISFQHVWHWTQKASEIYRARSKYVDSSELHVPLLDINPEGKLQREVKDILDELDIMLHVHRKQRDLIRRFYKHVEHILDPEGRANGNDFKEDYANPTADERYRNYKGFPFPGEAEAEPNRDRSRTREQERAKMIKRQQLVWFRIQYQELLSEVTDRIEELEGLRSAAKSTADSVNDLLSLKQQQASVVQAWESVRQAEESVSQGRAVMMFTIVTIVFLPLSFMSSIFGMNNKEFTDQGSMTLRYELKLMFTISIGITIITLVTAFSNLLRATLWSIYSYVTTLLIVRSGLYGYWVSFREEWQSQKILHKTEKQVREMKREVQKAKRRKRREERTNSAKIEKNANAEEGGLWNRLKKRWESPAPSPTTSTASRATNAAGSTKTGRSEPAAWAHYDNFNNMNEGSSDVENNGMSRRPRTPRFQLTTASGGMGDVLTPTGTTGMDMSGANTLHDVSTADDAQSRAGVVADDDDDDGPRGSKDFVITIDDHHGNER
ncbi:hypothetical protein B0T20DRAFT_244041 [Sordaria brevicollis]|uniref:Ankyrin repeat protein n=1 Tax=Sordaria brevicollis TaxID=83679 RepID=A0AAE0PBD8_SORBR|nr:hypothetical protein B0T20DRAFT_244041 [Sordaria brevicollis]